MLMQITQTGLLVLAFVSAVLNYAGFARIIPPDDWWLKALCLLTAIAVWISLYLFWRHAFSIIPQLRSGAKRAAGWATTLVGCIVIVALSSYWNVVAFAGPEVMRLADRGNIARAEQLFADAQASSGAHAQLVPQLNALSASALKLAEREELTGAVTGSPGKGGVSEGVRLIGAKVASMAASLTSVSKETDRLKADGQACLARMRAAHGNGGSSNASELAAAADCLNGVIAELGNQQAASGMAQALKGLSASVVAPVSIRSDAQRQAFANVLKGLQAQADSIAEAARLIPNAAPQALVLDRPNLVLAVLQNWQGIVPAIATALAIDLLPLLLLIMGVLFSRDREEEDRPRHLWTVEELADAERQINAMRAAKHKTSTDHQAEADMDVDLDLDLEGDAS